MEHSANRVSEYRIELNTPRIGTKARWSVAKVSDVTINNYIADVNSSSSDNNDVADKLNS